MRRLIAILVVALLGGGALLLSRSKPRPPAPVAAPTIATPTIAAPTVAAPSARPSVPPDEERRFLEIREAVRENRLSDMRDLASDYLRDYPHGVLRAQVESYSGVHPRPSGPDAQ